MAKIRDLSSKNCWAFDSVAQRNKKWMSIGRKAREKEKLCFGPKKMKNSDSLKSSNVCSDTQKRSSSFFKIMLQDFKNVLFIPPKFACNIGGLVKQTVHLHNSNGNSWNVKISVITGRLAFQDGWCDFVRDNSITEGEFVVFRYRGHSMFTVNIWGIDACERTCFNEKIKKCNIEVKRKASVFDCENIHLSKKHRTSEASENKCKFEKFDSMKKVRNEKIFNRGMFGKTKYPRKPVVCEEKKIPKTVEKASKCLNKFDMQPAPFTSNHGAALSHVIDEVAVDHVATKDSPVPICIIPSNMVTKEAENNIPVIGFSDPKLPVLSGRHSLPKKKFKIRTGDLIQLNEVVRKFLVTEDGVCHIFDENLMNEIAPSMSTRKENSAYGKGKEKPQVSGMSPVLASKENNDPPNASSMLKYHKHPRIMRRFSGRPGQGPYRNKKEVTEKDPPFLKGKSIQVKLESMNVKNLALLPSPDFGFSLSLTEQTAWVVLPVKLPSQFGKGKLARKMILIRDPHMRIWPVLYVEEIKFVGFIGGWEQFMRANKLKTGDCCKFEIALASEHTLQVQISSA